MIKNDTQLRIVIFSGYKIRELDTLLLLKKQLEKQLSAKVYILGGLSELQKMYYYLSQINPHVVFISQVLEKACRKLAQYVLNSGSTVFVVPAEITVIKVIEELLLNPDISYNDFLTKYLLPGNRYLRLLSNTDISSDKISIVGSPKIDCLVRAEGKQFYSRKQFANVTGIDSTKKNVFVFTSFVKAKEKYLRADPGFSKTINQMLESNVCIDTTKKTYIKTIQRLVDELPQYNIVLKPHPLEDPQPFQVIAGSNFTLLSQFSFYTCVRSIDLAIHWSSTVCPECWIKDIPTLQYAPHPEFDAFLSECHPGNPVIRTDQELIAAIRKYMSKKVEIKYQRFQKKYLQQNFYKLDGKAVERISTEVALVSKQKKLKPNFRPRHSLLVPVLIWVESMVGVLIAQRIIGLLLPSYDAQNAIENRVYIT